MKREADGDMGSPQKRSRSGDDTTVRLLIPSKAAGSIIGKGGHNITKLRTEYKASVTVPDCPGPERILTISSDLETVLQVVSEVIPNIEDASGRQGSRNDDVDLRLLVHQSQAGCIIGKSGFKIKELREKTGARIKIFSNCCPQSTERVCQISGRPNTCVDSLREIMELIKTSPIKGMNNPYDPHNYDDFHAQEYGGFGDQDKGGRGGPGGGGGMYGGMGGPPPMGRGGRFGPGVGNMGPGPRVPRGGMGGPPGGMGPVRGGGGFGGGRGGFGGNRDMCTKPRVKKPEPPRQRENPEWWTPECEEAIRARRRALKHFKAHQSDENLKNFRKARSKAKRLIRDLKAAAGLDGKSKSDSGEDSKVDDDLNTVSSENRDAKSDGESVVDTEINNGDAEVQNSENKLENSSLDNVGGSEIVKQVTSVTQENGGLKAVKEDCLVAHDNLVTDTKDDSLVAQDNLVTETKDDENVSADAPSG